MDIAIAVERIYKDADFRRSDTYENLVRTWHDKRIVPTEAGLAAAWETELQARLEQSIEDSIHRGNVVTLHNDVVLEGMEIYAVVDLLVELLRAAFPKT